MFYSENVKNMLFYCYKWNLNLTQFKTVLQTDKSHNSLSYLSYAAILWKKQYINAKTHKKTN